MRAADIMNTTVVTIEPQASVLDAARRMLQHRISGLPVVTSKGELVGIVTEGDFLRRAETRTTRHRPRWLEFLVGPGKLADEYTRSHGRKVEEIMTPEPVTVTEQTPVAAIVDLMERNGIKRLPVLRDGKLTGIVSRANLMRALASLTPSLKSNEAADWAIRDQILSDLRKQKWAPAAAIDVTVHRGVVDLWGTILDERERQALVVAIENVPGVKKTNDHLILIEAASGTAITF